jgi:hypothetical protein
MKTNKYWNNYKKKFTNKWHFDPKNKKSKDYIYIKNVKYDYKKLNNQILKLEKNTNIKSVIQNETKFKNLKLNKRIQAFKDWGYLEDQTKFTQIFSSDHPELFKNFIELSKLSNATASIIKQYPGNILPWHYDTHVTFKKMIKRNKEFKNKKVARYMIFLTDWDWGHYFAIGNNVIHQWKSGDMITWQPHMHHCGSNAGMIPKITLNITGFVEKNSLHKKIIKRPFF